jgi:hypothetical protein
MMREKRNLFIAMTTSLLLVTLVCPVKAFEESLLLYLSFDGARKGAVVKDLTGKTKGGTIIGGAQSVSGKYNRGLKLDGKSGYVEIELTREMIEAERNSFTAQLWLKTTVALGPPFQWGVDGFLLFGGSGPDEHKEGQWSMLLSVWGVEDPMAFDGLNFRFCVTNAAISMHGAGPGIITDSPRINDGKWHHLVAVRDKDAKVTRAYIDGELVGEIRDLTKSLNRRRDKLWLGILERRGVDEKSFLPATIDEVRFWGKALSDEEVMGVMELAVDPLEKLPATWGNIKARQMGNLGFE